MNGMELEATLSFANL